jgi:hypothetical protein
MMRLHGDERVCVETKVVVDKVIIASPLQIHQYGKQAKFAVGAVADF